MANVHTTLAELFSAIADAIRGKTGGSDSIKADDFPSAISGISGSAPTVTCKVKNSSSYDLTVYTDSGYQISVGGEGDTISIDCVSGGALVVVVDGTDVTYSNMDGMSYITRYRYTYAVLSFKVTATSGDPHVTIKNA